jgi:hypothetical protein
MADTPDLRKTLRKLPDGKFAEVSFRDLKKGDQFMLFESDGVYERDPSGFHMGRVHTALSDAYPPPEGATGWGIQVAEHDCDAEGCWTQEKQTARLREGDASWHDGVGWYYTLDELPDEGSCGAFKTREEAIAHATDCGYAVA